MAVIRLEKVNYTTKSRPGCMWSINVASISSLTFREHANLYLYPTIWYQWLRYMCRTWLNDSPLHTIIFLWGKTAYSVTVVICGGIGRVSKSRIFIIRFEATVAVILTVDPAFKLTAICTMESFWKVPMSHHFWLSWAVIMLNYGIRDRHIKMILLDLKLRMQKFRTNTGTQCKYTLSTGTQCKYTLSKRETMWQKREPCTMQNPQQDQGEQRQCQNSASWHPKY